MKTYPRIHSLSALGIRQHQAFNYEFHPFRTDFVGDSGCGKSMIADLLQLILVGSETYKSATESTDRRDVDGIVLRTGQGNGTEIGYAFLSIEMAKQQFLVIGAYLESSNKSSKSFLINASFEENELTPLTTHWGIDDFSEKGEIPTLEELSANVEKRGAVLHTFGVRKKFHAYLFLHKILPLDLAASKQLLENYSAIIQSFSRGRNLDIKKSESLKQFLFGDDKSKEIREKYRKAVEELKDALNEFNRNSAEINLSTRKHKALFELKKLRDDSECKKTVWLTKLYAFRVQAERACLEALREIVRESIDGYEHLCGLAAIISKGLSSAEIDIAIRRTEIVAAKEVYDEILPIYGLSAKFTKLLETYQCSVRELETLYADYDGKKASKAMLKAFMPVIHEASLAHLLDQFHAMALPDVVGSLDRQINELRSMIEQKKTYLAFTDINNKGSFGSWAIKNGQQLSREIESIVMHYKSIPVQVESGVKQYIPSPQAFIDDVEITNQDAAGFWLSIGKLRQYVEYVSDQLFTADNIKELSTVLESIGKNTQQEIDIFEKKNAELKYLKSVVLRDGFIEFLNAYKNQEDLHDFKEDPLLKISKDEFKKGLLFLNDKDNIENNYRVANENWELKVDEFKTFQQYVAVLQEAKDEIANITSTTNWGAEVTSIIEEIKSSLNLPVGNSKGINDYLEQSLSREIDKGKWLKKTLQDNKVRLNPHEILARKNLYSIALAQTKEDLKNVRIALATEPDIQEWVGVYLLEPKSEESDFKIADSLHLKDFDRVVSEYAKGDEFRFASSKNYIELCRCILPEAFGSNVIEEERVIDTIDRYLNTINEKNKNLNKRKIQKIREILDEVIDEVNSRLNTVREIRNFLNHEDREITGGNRVHLRANQTMSFPKAWMERFIQQLNDDDTLFASSQSLNDLLIDSTSLDEKMIQAFQLFSEYKRTKPKVNELLDPNCYFDLTFSMESNATGKTNTGSTGQTYAAIALLCIARLSLVNKNSIYKTPPRGLRFMPIDEAEGLGSNFDMLYEIARQYDYQIVTMSINPLGKFIEGQQYIYMLSNNKSAGEGINFPPFAIFYESNLTEAYRL